MNKEDFIIGNWYKTKHNNYFKFKELKNDYLYFSEEIINNKWSVRWGGRVGWRRVSGSGWKKEIFLSEIQEFLPEDHPDKTFIPIEKDYSYIEPLIKLLNNIENV